MAEIILPPEEDNEITPPDLPELNIDKPTENSKVITIEFEAKKTNKVGTKDTNQQLYTTDTDAWLEFKETSLESANGTYSVVFRNRHDGSIFQRTGDVVNGIAYYKIPHQEIRHAGPWRGQVVYTLSNGDTTAREFGYDVKGHMLDGKDVREIVVEDFETLMSQLRSMKDNAEVELANLVSTTQQNETDRQAFFDDLVEDIDELQSVFKANEAQRELAESERALNEEERELNERSRESAESVRVANEEERSENEQVRIENEEFREKAEGKRQSTFEENEQTRQMSYEEAESGRDSEYAARVTDLEEETGDARNSATTGESYDSIGKRLDEMEINRVFKDRNTGETHLAKLYIEDGHLVMETEES